MLFAPEDVRAVEIVPRICGLIPKRNKELDEERTLDTAAHTGLPLVAGRAARLVRLRGCLGGYGRPGEDAA